VPHKTRLSDPLKEATVAALKCVMDPLVTLMFDAGVTVHELTQLARQQAVQVAARRVSKDSGRDSNSRVAIITGLPRSEVSRLLKSDHAPTSNRLGQHPSRKVLATWFDNPRFLSATGDPAVLPIFGKRRSFEQLVAMHGRGIPVRAMLDELMQIDAIERLSDQRVRAKSRNPIVTGLTAAAIAVLGERTRDLLSTLTSNLRRASNPLFEATALVDDADVGRIPVLRREVAEQGVNFINAANSLLNRSRVSPSRPNETPSAKCRLGVTVYYFQDNIESATGSKTQKIPERRKNLKRQRNPTPNGKRATRRLSHSLTKGHL
jgi:hypothetical protein